MKYLLIVFFFIACANRSRDAYGEITTDSPALNVYPSCVVDTSPLGNRVLSRADSSLYYFEQEQRARKLWLMYRKLYWAERIERYRFLSNRYADSARYYYKQQKRINEQK